MNLIVIFYLEKWYCKNEEIFFSSDILPWILELDRMPYCFISILFIGIMKVILTVVPGKKCYVCRKKCIGEILKAEGEKYIHISCFKCASKLSDLIYLKKL